MRPGKTKGFTLLELLVVFGIVVCLVGIVLPTLVGAREQSKRVQCLSNLRSLTAAWLAYATDNEGHICSSVPGGALGWVGSRAGLTGLEGGKLWSYLTTPDVYRCPDELTPKPDGVTESSTVVANNISYQINGLLAGKMGDPYTRTKLNELLQPAKTYVFIEGSSLMPLNNGGEGWGCFPTPIYPANVFTGPPPGEKPFWADWPGENHLNGNVVAGTSISFADGHAVFWPYFDTRTGNLRAALSEGTLNTVTGDGHGNQITVVTGGAPNSPDVYQLEGWSGGTAPPGVNP